ncbi:NACHT domain- and WD repeat-containing protein 1-like [Anneissia japonica]|uniref:NACHT domain- and WD repeat-containing protein 1-like n=1 Tax=Anneissia japonica TaxID=1529436 RepID=UPI0014255418|nr:NACHT domain- and WD repeat-containing protein 1-like [Anneissia japonica]
MGNAVGVLPGAPVKANGKKNWKGLSAYRTAHMATIRMRASGLWNTPRDDRQVWKKILEDAADEFEDFLIECEKDDIENREEFREMMYGGIPDSHIKRNGNEVWVFVSSTFTDTQMERDILMEDVYPYLREFCRKIGLDFNVVDLRWGIRKVLANSHQATSICLTEVQRCRATSIGPFFVGILGYKYGWRPIPRTVESATFMTFLTYIENSTSRDTDDDKAIELIKDWYRLDLNALKPEFVLQPITHKFPNYDKRDSDDIKGWYDTFDIMQKAIFTAVRHCQLPQDLKVELTRSITEGEIMEAISENSEDKRCFFFDRDLKGFDAQEASKIGYVDMSSGNVDSEAYKKLENLKAKIWDSLPSQNLSRYKIDFKPSNSEMQDTKENKESLRTFCDKFCDYMVNSIREGAAEHRSTMKNSVYAEVINHSVFARERAEMFSGREPIVAEMMNYLKKESGKKPYVLHGVGGSGKTSILAKVFSKSLTRWGSITVGRPVHIVRFIGVTPESSNIRDLLYSICKQLCYVLKLSPSTVPVDYKQLEKKFLEMLGHATSSRPFVVFIDSLDQLSDDNEGRDLHWLPCYLPNYVHMIVTVRPNAGGCLAASQNVVKSQEYFLEVLPPDEADTNAMIDLLLAKSNRTVTSCQKKIIIGAHRDGKPTPLYLKLACDIAKSWHSYTEESHCKLADTVNGLINQLFTELEESHGQTLVREALGYITAAKTGLSANELLDVLSCDETVLDDCFEFHIPPIRRLPSLLWTRLRLDLGSYLVEGGADDVVVYRWYHRIFHEVARQRYLTDNEEFLHQSLAHYFIGRWADVPKPYRDKKTNEMNIANRRLPPQPLVLVNRKGEMDNNERYNLRKLTELPFHLIRAGMWQDCEKELCTIQWIRAKCKTGRCYQLVLELAEASAKAEHSQILRDFYRLVRANIHTLQLHPELICQQALNEPDSSVCMNVAMNFIKERSKKMSCLLDLTKNQSVNPEVMTLQHTSAVKLCKFSPSAKYLATVSQDETLRVWRVASGALEMTLECGALKIEFPSNCHWVCCLTRNGISIYGLGTGGFPKGKKVMRVEIEMDHLAAIFIPKSCKAIQVVSYGRLSTYGFPSGRLIQKKELKCRPKHVAFSPNGKWLALANKTVFLWDISKEEEVKTFGANGLSTNLTGSFLAFSSDSKRVLGILPNGTYRWNTTGKNPEPIGNKLSLNCMQGEVVFSPNLDYVASMNGESTLRILKFQKNGATWTYLKGHTGPVISCSFERSQDDTTMVATGSEDQSVRIWDSRDLSTENFARAIAHTHAIESCVFSPDGTRAVTVADNKTVYFWETNVSPPTVTCMLASDTSCHVNRIGCISSDGMFVVGFCGDQAVDIWNTASKTTSAHSMTINCKHKLVPFASPNFFFVQFMRSGLNVCFSTGNKPGVLYCMTVLSSTMVDEWKSFPDNFPADVYESDLRDFKHGDNQKIVSAVMNKDGNRLATISIALSENQKAAAMLADVEVQGTLSCCIWSPSYSRILKKCSLDTSISRAHQLEFIGSNVIVLYQKYVRNSGNIPNSRESVIQVLDYDTMNTVYSKSVKANYDKIFVKPNAQISISDGRLVDSLLLGHVQEDMLHITEWDSNKAVTKYCYKSLKITSFDLSRDRRSIIVGFENGSVRFLRFVNIK